MASKKVQNIMNQITEFSSKETLELIKECIEDLDSVGLSELREFLDEY